MEKFIEFIASILGVSNNKINKDTKYMSIPQWDSLMQIRLVAEIEEKYDIDIPIDIIEDLKSIEDFYKLIQKG